MLLIQNTQYAAILAYARRYDDALEHLQRTRELDANFVNVKSWLCRVYNLKGMYAESLGISEPTLDTDEAFLNDAAYAFAMTGQRAKALAMLSRIKDREKRRYVSNYSIAAVYVALGDKDAAFAEMEKAYQARDWTLPRIKVDPLMDPLRDDPRFDQMVKRLNLSE